MGGELQGLLDQAQETAAAGRQAEAFELHQRYHEQSREVTSQFGVRLSFALSRWADLGRGYPPARQALRQTRQAAADRLRAGRRDPDLSAGDQRPYTAHRAHPAHSEFAEVAAISSRPDDEQYAADLFAELDRQAPDVAADCWAAARSLLVRTGDFQVARRYLGDPQRAVVRAASILDQRLTRGFARFPEQLREKMRQDAVNGYIADVREMLTILDGVGAHELSAATRQQAVDAVVWRTCGTTSPPPCARRSATRSTPRARPLTMTHDPWGPPEVECSTRDRDPDAGAEPPGVRGPHPAGRPSQALSAKDSGGTRAPVVDTFGLPIAAVARLARTLPGGAGTARAGPTRSSAGERGDGRPGFPLDGIPVGAPARVMVEITSVELGQGLRPIRPLWKDRHSFAQVRAWRRTIALLRRLRHVRGGVAAGAARGQRSRATTPR